MLYKGEGTSFDADGKHWGSIDTYKHIANWCDTPFPYSRTDSTERFGILGMLGHTILSSLPGTCIIEIGVGESSIYLTEAARRLHRKIFYCDLAYGKIFNPLTVPGYLHENLVLIENRVISSYDSYSGVAYVGTSDDFFRDLKFPPVGLAFIDGDHHYEAVKRDFDNIFRLLVPHGVIFLHDTWPPSEESIVNDYCSTAYKMRKELESREDVDCFTFTSGVACSVGLTMCRKRSVGGAHYHE